MSKYGYFCLKKESKSDDAEASETSGWLYSGYVYHLESQSHSNSFVTLSILMPVTLFLRCSWVSLGRGMKCCLHPPPPHPNNNSWLSFKSRVQLKDKTHLLQRFSIYEMHCQSNFLGHFHWSAKSTSPIKCSQQISIRWWRSPSTPTSPTLNAELT